MKNFEITHKMMLIMRIIRHGFDYANQGVIEEDRNILISYENKTKEELLKEYKGLKNKLG